MSSDKRHVGIIDDTEAVRHLLARIVDSSPKTRTAWSAATGREGLELASTEPPHLIIVDLYLPDIPGQQVVQELRRTIPDRTRILVLTGMLDQQRRKDAKEAGADQCIQKGEDLQTLRQTIEQLASA